MFGWSSSSSLWAAKKFLVVVAGPKHVFEDFFMIIPTRRNKRGQFWMLQCDDMPPNVSWWPFFGFHTLSKAFTREIVLKLSKNCVLVIFHSVFVGREKTFRVSCRHQTCIVRLCCDHTYTQKWTGSVLDTSMRWYIPKRELMALFWISYPPKNG